MKNSNKKINKILVGLFLGTAISGLGLFIKSKEGKNIVKKILEDIKLGLKEMKITFNAFLKKKK